MMATATGLSKGAGMVVCDSKKLQPQSLGMRVAEVYTNLGQSKAPHGSASQLTTAEKP
jgi:hypothetical protein